MLIWGHECCCWICVVWWVGGREGGRAGGVFGQSFSCSTQLQCWGCVVLLLGLWQFPCEPVQCPVLCLLICLCPDNWKCPHPLTCVWSSNNGWGICNNNNMIYVQTWNKSEDFSDEKWKYELKFFSEIFFQLNTCHISLYFFQKFICNEHKQL